MKKYLHGFLLFGLLIGLPLAGVWSAGRDISTYLEFPPRTQYVEHAPFSWTGFIGLSVLVLAIMLPFLICIGRASAPRTARRAVPIPWWGWTALGLFVIFWILAWTRFAWFEAFQLYTFTPLWLGYIVIINALTYRRSGRCLMLHEPKYFISLFFLSAGFWWFFEYLNRFVQNWYYVECAHFSAEQYLLHATLAFSTVLPAVLSTEEWLAVHPRCYAGLTGCGSLHVRHPKTLAWGLLLLSGAGLLLIGLYPDLLFPLLWVAPLLLLLSLRTLAGMPSCFPEVARMDFSRIFRFALAALICGFFWEMWNYYSLAKWIYGVPYVHRFQVFEMPILGYAGYLPFGLECAVIAQLIQRQPHND
ncbi:MAG: hypothetical protein JXR25_17460 [Pontiellaceae bacterium]|nr:hypothetical protein [Pontiellaceae bacterium]MBN2786608.1 hypothetical protein [Pontiellaceae bacterium]